MQIVCSYAAAWLGLEPAAGGVLGSSRTAAGISGGASSRQPQEALVLQPAGVFDTRINEAAYNKKSARLGLPL